MDAHDLHYLVDQQHHRQYPDVTVDGSARVQLGDHIGDEHHYHYPTLVERAESPPSPSFTVPFPRDKDFVDRGTILTDIERRCDEGGARVALVGIGGVGKSQLAIEYCYCLRKRSPDTWVFWIHASNTDRVEQGYREIAEEAKIPSRNDPRADIFELVKKWLRNEKKGKWLLVLDNLDDDTVLTVSPKAERSRHPQNLQYAARSLLDYLPPSENGAVLVTTRTTNVAHKLVELRDTIEIGPMTETDATKLMTKKFNSYNNDADLQDLARVLEFMPLAIVQATAYIEKRAPRFSVRQYIDKFNESDQTSTSLLDHEAGHLRRDTEAKNSIIITWQLSFNHIREKWPSAADLLSLMSFFDRQGIPEHVLTVGSREMEENSRAQHDEDNRSAASGTESFETDLERLRDYSFVSVEAGGRTFVMHRLVQLATRRWLIQHVQDMKQRTLFLKKLSASFPTGAYENHAQCEALFPHAKAAEAQQPDYRQSNEPVRDWARIMRNAGWYAWARGHYSEAERMCSKSTSALEGGSGQDDVELSYSQGMLASVFRNQGRWNEAEELEVQVMETRERVLGREHPDTLTSMANLASTYWNQGRWKEAEELQVQVMETRERVLGREHPHTLTSMANLASTYRNQGRWKEAEELEVQVMETSSRVLGREHPHTLTSMANLASTYWNQGRWKEAEELEVQVMETRERVLGREHPDTLTSINNLASTYMNQGRWKEAEELQVQVIKTRERVLGREHPDTLTSINNLAWTFKLQQRNDKAIALMTSCQQLLIKTLGSRHHHSQAASVTLLEWQKSAVQQRENELPILLDAEIE